MAQLLSMGSNERQDNWDELLPRVESAYNSSVNLSTRLAPNEIHIGRLPRLPHCGSSTPPLLAATRAWTETTRPVATSPPSAKDAPTASSANPTPSPLHVLPAETTPLWTPFAFHSRTPWAAGRGSTTPRPLCEERHRHHRAQDQAFPELDWTVGDSRLWTQRRPPTSPTTDPIKTNTSSSTPPPINLDGTPNVASPSSAATPTEAPATPATCSSTYLQTS